MATIRQLFCLHRFVIVKYQHAYGWLHTTEACSKCGTVQEISHLVSPLVEVRERIGGA